MTPRNGLLVAVMGAVISAACAIPLYFIGNDDPVSNDADMGIIVLYLSGMFGVTVLVIGLIIAVATAWQAKHRRPS